MWEAHTLAELIAVEDDPQVRLLLARVLARAGHGVREAGTGAELRRCSTR